MTKKTDGRSTGWTAERKAKMLATRAAKKAGKKYGNQLRKPDPSFLTSPRVFDAISYLKHAQAAMNRDLSKGKLKRLDKSHLLALLALSELTGE